MFILGSIFNVFDLVRSFFIMIGNGLAAISVAGSLIGFFTSLFTR